MPIEKRKCKLQVYVYMSELESYNIIFTERGLVLMVRSSHVGYIVGLFTSWTHMNATTKSLLWVGHSKFSELGACEWKNVSDAMDAAKD